MNDKISKFHIEKVLLKYKSSIGLLEFRFITLKDIEFFGKLNKNLSNKEFSIKAIFNQLETNIDFEEFSNISEKELEKIIEEYSKKSKLIYNYYPKIESTDIFLKFKKSILSYLEEERKRMELLVKSINKQFEPMKKIIENSFAFSKMLFNIPVPQITLPKLIPLGISNQLVILNYSFSKYFEEQFKLWQNFTIQYKELNKKSLKNLKKYNWFINLSMPASFVAKTAGVHNAKEMKELFISYHTHNHCEVLSKYLKKWKANSLFKKRIKILSDTINLFNNEWKNKEININNVIIPVLINQIEGLRCFV